MACYAIEDFTANCYLFYNSSESSVKNVKVISYFYNTILIARVSSFTKAYYLALWMSHQS